MKNRVPLYTLSNFLKFERTIYTIFGLPLGRPISLKTFIYALIFGVLELILYFTPILGRLINWIPPIILIIIPFVLAWLLADVGTEGRSPFSFFRSFLSFWFRRISGKTLYRGKRISKPRKYTFANYYTFKVSEPRDLKERKDSIRQQIEARKYIRRIKYPDKYFEPEKGR